MDIKSEAFKKIKQKWIKERRKKIIENLAYWKQLLPEFSINDNPFSENLKAYDIDNGVMNFCLEQLKHDGYFVTPPIIPKSVLNKLEICIKKVTERKHPPSYALLYDIFYQVMQSLENILQPVLGENYQLVPDEPSAFYVVNNDNSKGTSPHRDSVFEHGEVVCRDGIPSLINIWIPITDADADNSCMYLIPLSKDPFFENGVPMPLKQKQFSRDEVSGLLQRVRAVPAKAGSVLGWNTNLMHWGGMSSRFARGPRLSFAVYFQSASVPPYHKFAMNIPSRIPFDYRLYLIEKLYYDRELRNENFKEFQSLWFDNKAKSEQRDYDK